MDVDALLLLSLHSEAQIFWGAYTSIASWPRCGRFPLFTPLLCSGQWFGIRKIYLNQHSLSLRIDSSVWIPGFVPNTDSAFTPSWFLWYQLNSSNSPLRVLCWLLAHVKSYSNISRLKNSLIKTNQEVEICRKSQCCVCFWRIAACYSFSFHPHVEEIVGVSVLKSMILRLALWFGSVLPGSIVRRVASRWCMIAVVVIVVVLM